MSYRADFVISIFGMIMTNLSGFVTFMILFHNFPSINGWDYYHMLFLHFLQLNQQYCVFDVKGIGQFIFGMATFVYAWSHIGIPVTVVTIAQAVLFLITASLFMIAIMNAAAATCFWIINSGYVMVIMFRFKDFAKYPSNIFNGVFKFIFTFIIPIAFVAYYPSLVFVTPDHIPLLTWLSPLIGVGFFYLSYKFWMLGVRKYDFTGS